MANLRPSLSGHCPAILNESFAQRADCIVQIFVIAIIFGGCNRARTCGPLIKSPRINAAIGTPAGHTYGHTGSALPLLLPLAYFLDDCWLQ